MSHYLPQGAGQRPPENFQQPEYRRLLKNKRIFHMRPAVLALNLWLAWVLINNAPLLLIFCYPSVQIDLRLPVFLVGIIQFAYVISTIALLDRWRWGYYGMCAVYIFFCLIYLLEGDLRVVGQNILNLLAVNVLVSPLRGELQPTRPAKRNMD